MKKIFLIALFFSMPVLAQAGAGIVFNQSTGTISGVLSGNGNGLTNLTIFVSSYAVSPFTITSTSDVGVATATFNMRGSRPFTCHAMGTFDNSSGNARKYSYSFLMDGVKWDEGDYWQNNQAGGTEYFCLEYASNSISAGIHTFSLLVNTDNVTGTQYLRHGKVLCMEY